MNRHFKILAVLYVLFGLSNIGAAMLVRFLMEFAAYSDSILMTSSKALLLGPDLVLRSIPIWAVTTIIPLFLGVPAIIGGIGIYFGKNWARLLLLVVGTLALIDFPLGTALGVYTIWALLQPETKLQPTT
jgi:hypothetical protein